MAIQFVLIQLLFICALVCSALLAISLYNRRSAKGALFLSLFMGVAFFWSLGALMEITAPTQEIQLFWLAFSFLGITFSPVLCLAFALDYTRNTRWLSWKYFIPLLLLPLAVQIISWLPQTRSLIWDIDKINATHSHFSYSYGMVFWIFYSYAYALVAIAVAILIKNRFGYQSSNKIQTYILILACIFTLVFNSLTVFHVLAPFNVDLTPLGFNFSILAIYWGIYRFDIFNKISFAQSEIIDNLSDAVVIIDFDNHILFRNQAFVYHFIRSDRSVIGLDIHEVIPQMKITELIESGGDFEEYELQNRDCIYEVRLSLIKIHDEHEGVGAIVFHEITPLKQKEAKLRLLAHDLQAQLTENVSLISDLKSFSYKVAHDLKSPLNAIIGFGELIEEETKDHQQVHEQIRTVNRTSAKMLSIINELLIFSNITTREVIRQPMEMKSIVLTAIDRCSSLVEETEAKITVADDWPGTEGYAFWIEEVWVNLISNAIKYGGQPPVISIGWHTDANGVNWFHITDNGIGITSEQLETLFKPFSRYGSTAYESHGIGLSIVDRIIRKLGGQITVESQGVPGQGSTFRFSLFS